MKWTKSSFCRRRPSWDSSNIPTWSSCMEWSLWENPWVQYTSKVPFSWCFIPRLKWGEPGNEARYCLQNHCTFFALLTENGSAGAYGTWWFEGFSDQEEASVCITLKVTELKFEVLTFLLSFHCHINLTVLGSLYPHRCHSCVWTSAVR